MLKKFGEKSNYFYCKKDEIFYWVDYNTIKRYIYFVACPICKYRICQFCSSTYRKYRICCLKRKIYSLLFVGGPSYLKNEYIFEGSYLYCILIPGLSFVSISIQIKHILKCDGGEPSFLEAYDSCKIISEGMLFIILSIIAVFLTFNYQQEDEELDKKPILTNNNSSSLGRNFCSKANCFLILLGIFGPCIYIV